MSHRQLPLAASRRGRLHLFDSKPASTNTPKPAQSSPQPTGHETSHPDCPSAPQSVQAALPPAKPPRPQAPATTPPAPAPETRCKPRSSGTRAPPPAAMLPGTASPGAFMANTRPLAMSSPIAEPARETEKIKLLQPPRFLDQPVQMHKLRPRPCHLAKTRHLSASQIVPAVRITRALGMTKYRVACLWLCSGSSQVKLSGVSSKPL